MHHIVYQTTNLINNKIYIGKHSTENIDDGYLGRGIALTKAIKKYGRENFKRTILHFCSSSEKAYIIESVLVDVTFVKREDTYNLVIGGHAGGIGLGRLCSEYTRQKISDSEQGKTVSKETCKKISLSKKGRPIKRGRTLSKDHKQKLSEKKKGTHLSEEHKRHISESLKLKNIS